MKNLIFILALLLSCGFNAQVASPTCAGAENVCSSNGSTFSMITSGVTAFPGTNSVSNPSSNVQGVNAGCLLSGGPNPNFFVINVATAGNLEFVVGGPGGSGCFDWAMWPYNAAACTGITGNTLPPVSCNWNGNCNGWTGMWNGGTPPGGAASNFQPSIFAAAGSSYILCFSNYSYQNGNAQLSFPTNPGSAGITCSPGTPDQTICAGNSATVSLVASNVINSATWLVTTGVSNTAGINNVIVTPPVTTQYVVQMNIAGLLVNDTFMINVVQAPAPNAGVDQTICLGSPILLSGSVPTPPNTIAWQTLLPVGLVPPATATFSPNFSNPTPTVTVNQPGTYKFVLRETNTLCGVVRDTVTVVVSQLQISAAPTDPSCNGSNDGQITITSVGATQFSFDNGVTWGASPTATGLLAGTFTICARNPLGCQKCTTAVLTNPAAVVLTVSPDLTICQNGSAAMSASAVGGASHIFTWQNGGLGANVVVPFAATQYFSVFATNSAGCLSPSDSILVTVRAPLSGTMSPDVFVCPTYPGNLTASVSGGDNGPYNFVWSTGTSTNGLTSLLTNNPTQNILYSVTVTDNCESTPLVLTGNILMHQVPNPQFQVLNPLQCEPAVFDLVNTTDPANSASATWRISYGDEFVNMNEIQTSALLAGTYDLELIIVSPNGCIDSTDFPGALIVLPKPIADFRWSPNPMTMFNTTAQFSNTSSNADSYQWTFNGGSPGTSSSESPQSSFPDGIVGSYEVVLIANSDLGCSDTVSKLVEVKPEVIIYAPNSFTPDGDEFNQTWFVTMEGIDVFDFDLFVFNRWGEIIWESHDPKGEWDGTYKGEIIKAGVYTWVIRTKDAINDKKYEFNGFINIIR